MEYVIVTGLRARTVYIDGSPSGRTGVLLMVEEGTHTFTLGKPLNYSPPSLTISVVDTTVQNPLVLAFADMKRVRPAAPSR